MRDKTRLLGLDLARGLAIIGMSLIHFRLVLGDPTALAEPSFFDLLDGRPAALFMVLAGIGLALMTRAAPSRLRLTRRGLFLLVLGTVNLLLWPGDILRVYGLSFLIVIPLIRAPRRLLWILGLAVPIAFTVLVLSLGFGERWDWDSLTYRELWTFQGALANLFYDGFRSVLPWTGFLIIGLALGRGELRDPAWRRRWLRRGLILWIGAEVLSRSFLTLALDEPGGAEAEDIIAAFGTRSIPALPLFWLSSLGAAITTIAAGLSIAERAPKNLLVRSLVALGQLALSNYLAHIYGGLGLAIVLGLVGLAPALALALGAGYLMLAAALSLAWLRRGWRGPWEALMRRVCG